MKKFLISVILITTAILVAWKINYPKSDYPSGEWRYKITMEIETPEGIKTGSTVREISNSTPRLDFPDNGNPATVKGEAVVIDLGQRGLVFSLITDRSDEELYRSFPTQGPSTPKGIRYYNSLKAGMKADLPPMYYPAFVMFKDINDPKSVTLVREEAFFPMREKKAPIDNFEELFGAGVKLKSITVEITDAPVSWGIEKGLPWLPEVLMSNIDGTSVSFENKLSNTLHGGNFKTGEKL